jgi:polyisoprenoid-binding protein YceI
MSLSATFVALALAAQSPAVPQGNYTNDKPHTSLIFRVSHMGFSTFTARFTGVDAALKFDPANLPASNVKVTIDPTSISSDNAPDGFLAMLSGPQWLDAARFPQMTFRSNSVELTGANAFRIRGDLTLHGVTKPVVLDARYNGGYAGQPMDPHARVGFSAHGTFKRSDFGISIGIPAPGSRMGVGDDVEVVLETEFSGPALAKTAQ